MTLEIRIRYSHNEPSGGNVYDVYANHKQIGTLTQAWRGPHYHFQSNRTVKLSVNFKTFQSLTIAIRELPSLIPTWIAEAVVNGAA